MHSMRILASTLIMWQLKKIICQCVWRLQPLLSQKAVHTAASMGFSFPPAWGEISVWWNKFFYLLERVFFLEGGHVRGNAKSLWREVSKCRPRKPTQMIKIWNFIKALARFYNNCNYHKQFSQLHRYGFCIATSSNSELGLAHSAAACWSWMAPEWNSQISVDWWKCANCCC